MLRGLLSIMTALLTALLLLLIGVSAATTTESGTRWLLSHAVALSPWPLQLQYQSGTLWTGLTLQQVSFTHPRWALQIDQVSADWQIDWQQISIHHLQAQQVHLQLFSNGGTAAKKKFDWQHLPPLQLLASPFALHLQSVRIEQFFLQQADDLYAPMQLQLTADWQQDLSGELQLRTTGFDPSILHPQLVAKLDADLSLQFHNNAAGWQLNLMPSEIRGTWQQSAFIAKLTASWQTQQAKDFDIHLQLQSEQWRYAQWELKNLHSDVHLQARLPWPIHRDDWQLKILPSEMTAQWQGQPLKINAQALIDAKQASQLLLKATLAENQLSMALQQPFMLSWQLKAPRLARVWPDLQGQVFSQGNISGSLRDPLINAELSAQKLRYQQQTLAALKVLVQGKLSQHDLQMTADDLRGKLQLKAQGGVNIDARSQRYQLLSSSISVPKLGKWQQQQSSVWSNQAANISIERSCWQQQSTRICAALKGQLPALVVDAELWSLPLSRFQDYLPKNLGISGRLNADLHGQYQNKMWLGNANVQVSAGALQYPLTGKNKKLYSWRSARLQLQQDAQQLQANLHWDYQQYGQINGQLRRRASGDLSGNLQANFQQIQLLEPFLVGVQNLQGQVLLDVQVAGRLPTPQYSGSVHWQNGSLRIPAQNLHITAMELRGVLLPNSLFSTPQMAVTGSAQSDRGQVKLTGQLALPTRWPRNFYEALSGQLRLQGEDFQVSNTKRSKVWISPDLSLTLAPQKMDLRGQINIPQANVVLKELPVAVVRASKDVVLIQNGQPLVSEQVDWQQYLSTDVQVNLGKAVNFQGLGLQADLSGNLQLLSTPGKPAQAYGEILIPKGSYQKYGQDLTIEQGVLRFQGAPDNPALNIQALRHTDFADVTLALGGTLKTPSSKVYSSPSLPDTEAMALLVTGKPLSTASSEENNRLASAAFSLGVNRSQSLVNRVAKTVGVDTLEVQPGSTGMNDSSLLIGKYLNPNLYVSYIRGLFAQTSSVGMEYKLTPKASIKAQSGSESSLDVLYRFERD
jgi:translocation and assembly module TamB